MCIFIDLSFQLILKKSLLILGAIYSFSLLLIIEDLSLFDAIFSGIDDATHNKPSPQPYLTAMRHFGLSAHECWIVEDSTTGIKSGLATGASGFAVGAHFADPKLVAQCGKNLTTLMALFIWWAR